MTDRQLPKALSELLDLSAMSLATTGSDGEPHVAPVYFALSGAAHLAEDGGVPDRALLSAKALRLYFFSDEDSQHAHDLQVDPRASAAIYPECRGWQDIRGLQLRGVVQAVPPGDSWEQAWKSYRDKFPFVMAFKAVVARNRFYVFIPEWLRLVDNRRGFGYKQEWTFE